MMLKKFLRANTIALLAITAVLGCAPDSSRDAVSPTETHVEAVNGAAAGSSVDFVRITETPQVGLPLNVSAVIGLLGGVLNLGGHSLVVPYGAVSLPSLFTMTRTSNTYVEVDLMSVRQLLGQILNIGELGFNKPVTVKLSYARANNVTDPSRLKIMRLLPNGGYEILPSTVDTRTKTVSAKLDHFSRYCMVSD
jgi:hypothetical protein